MGQKKLIVVVSIVLFLFGFACPLKTAAKEQTVIKVGYSNSEFLYAGSKNAYAGYGYELLQTIAQYEPVKYEYIYANPKELRKMLEKGEIDLLAPMNKDEKLVENFDFTDLSIGSSQMVISTVESSDTVDRLNTERIAVGMMAGSTINKKSFRQYCKENNIDALLVPFSSFTLLKDGVKERSIDAVFAERWDINHYQILARFGVRDMYFAVTKGNEKVLSLLNEGLEKIEADFPEYRQMLYEKYYASNDITGTVLTSAEKKFLEGLGTVKIAVPGNIAPLQQEEEQGKFSGIHIEVLNTIADKIGVIFEYSNTETLNHAVELMKNGEVDIICNVVDNMDWADHYGFLLTSSYMDNILALVKPKEQNLTNGKRVLAQFNHNVKFSGYYNSSILECASLEECVRSVKEGKTDFTYGNIYAIDYIRAKAAYRDFDVSTISESGGKFCFAMSKQDDLTLYHIINKTVKSITSEMIEGMVVNATMNRKTEFSLLGYIYDHTIGVILVIFMAAILVVFVFIYFMRKSTIIEKQISEKYTLLEQRYETVMDLTGDCLFEYIPEMDIIYFSKSLSEKFGLKRQYKNFQKFDLLVKDKIHSDDMPIYEEFIKKLLTAQFHDSQIQVRFLDKKQEYEKYYLSVCCVQGKEKQSDYILGRLYDEHTKIMEKTNASDFKGVYSYLEIRDMIEHTLEQSEQREKHVMILMNIRGQFEEGSYKEETDPLSRALTCIQSCVRGTDIIGRSGDEQLLLFMTRIQSREQIENKLSKIKRLLRDEFYLDSIEIQIGYSVYPLQGETYGELYELAVSDMVEL